MGVIIGLAGRNSGDTSTGAGTGTTAATPPGATRCLEYTEQLAGRELTQARYVRARNENRQIEVWICRDCS